MNDAPDNAGSGARDSSLATSGSLLAHVRAGEAAAWNRLVGLYGPLIFAWCRRRDLQDQDIADVCQDVFLAVARHINTFRKQQPQDTFRGWLHRITANKIHDLYRRRGQEPVGAGGTDAHRRLAQVPAPREPEEASAVEGRAERGLLQRALRRVRDEFEERTWQAFWRTAVEGRSAAEAAAELGTSPGAVRVAKSRVLHRLREELGDLDE
jgi:RNA polymerase sigma-70 factor (ECF subfamily)